MAAQRQNARVNLIQSWSSCFLFLILYFSLSLHKLPMVCSLQSAFYTDRPPVKKAPESLAYARTECNTAEMWAQL